jgi:glycosyltransferase involved in cell wall biosynthesis
MTNNNPIIYIDDDKLPHKDLVEYCLQRYIKYPFALQSRWSFQQPRTYWGPPRIRATEEDIEVDYVGTNMMVLDKSIFNDPMMLEIPEEWKNIEDLWMCHVARKNQQRPLYSMLSKVTEIRDNKDQYHSLATKKNEMYQWMKEDGFQTIDNQKGPIISIIIVTYNRWDLSKKCIDSVIENTPKGTYEIIVVDNCSTDETIENLNNYKNQGLIHKIIFNDSNYQLSRAFNIGYGNVSDQVDYIMTLNNDHFVMKGWYYNMLAAFKNKSIDFVSGLARGNFFHLKDEVIDRDTNCRFFVLSNKKIKTYKHNTSDLYLLYDDNVQEIGEALIFRSELIFNNIVKWFEGFPGGGWKGSYHAKMIKEIIKPYNLKGVELGRPCVLTQKNYMTKFEDYYRMLFKTREKNLPLYDYHFDIIKDKEEYYKWTNYLEESSNGK